MISPSIVYSSAPTLTEELQSMVRESIILAIAKRILAERCKFVGVLYAGLMIKKESGLPKLMYRICDLGI